MQIAFNYQGKFKLIASGIIIFLIILGIVLLSLNILDIGESFRLGLPINIFNSIFISGLALPILCISILAFMSYGSPSLLVLGGAHLAIGMGIILKDWVLSINFFSRINIYESGLILASLVFFIGGLLTLIRLLRNKAEFDWNDKVLIWFYAGMLIVITTIVLLAIKEIIPWFFNFRSNTTSVQNVLQIVSIILLFASFATYLKICYSSRSETYFWYFLGLMALAFGVLFISQSPVEGRLAWDGRFLQYTGNICFLTAVILEYKRVYKKRFYKNQFRRFFGKKFVSKSFLG